MEKQIASRCVIAMVVMTAVSAWAGLFDAIKNVATETVTIRERPRQQNVKGVNGSVGSSTANQRASSVAGNDQTSNRPSGETSSPERRVKDSGGALSKGQPTVEHDKAAEWEPELATFVQQIGQKASGDNNPFVGVEVYKGIRLGMTEREFHKIEKGHCDSSIHDAERFNYPSVKANQIVKRDKDYMNVITVFLGGLDFEKNLNLQHLDEDRQNFLVTRVRFDIRGAAKIPGIKEIENKFAKRFGDGVKINYSAREMFDGDAPDGKRMYPVVELSKKGQKVVLTQPDMTEDVEVTAIYEVAEDELRKLRSSYEEKAKKEDEEKAKKEALDF